MQAFQRSQNVLNRKKGYIDLNFYISDTRTLQKSGHLYVTLSLTQKEIRRIILAHKLCTKYPSIS